MHVNLSVQILGLKWSNQVLDRNNFASCKAVEETLTVNGMVTPQYLLLSLHYCVFTQLSPGFTCKPP